MGRIICAAVIIILSLVLEPIPGAEGSETIYIGHDFEDGNIGGDLYGGGGGYTVTVEVVDGAAPWTGESKALHYKKQGQGGTHEIQFEGTAPLEAGYIIESVFMVPAGANIVAPASSAGCMVLKSMSMSADFWLADSGDPNTFLLRTWQYDFFSVELERGVWHKLQAHNQEYGTWNKYYLNDEFWCQSSVGVEYPGTYGNRMWFGRDSRSDAEWEVYIDHFWCYSATESDTEDPVDTSTHYIMCWDEDPDKVFQVLWTEDLANPSWEVASDFIISNNRPTTWEDEGDTPAGRPDPEDTSVTQRFYKMIEREDVYYVPSDDPIPIAHRGVKGQAPENTLAAIIPCMQLGFGFEFDVRTSEDGELILMHDQTIGRTTDGPNYPPSFFTVEELKEFDAGSWFGPRFAGEQIPTLEEVLIAVNQYQHAPTFLAINVKDITLAGETTLVNLVTDYGLLEESFAFDQGDAMSQRFKNINPNFRIGNHVRNSVELQSAISDPLIDVIMLAGYTPSQAEINNIHAAGKQVLYNNGGGNPDEIFWETLRSLGIDGILSDYPLDMAAYFHE